MLNSILDNGYSREQNRLKSFLHSSGSGSGAKIGQVENQLFPPDYFFFKAGPVIMSIEEKMEADARSIYVGNVCIRVLIGVGERNISRIGGGFGEYWEGLEEVKGNGDQQRLWSWKRKD